ncbi:ABC transporter permease subunit [Actinacidiphila reveromycinica]|uniref:ABC transporter permease subunit n=1 Tax=Actinacidiphila reveromycinica TaxID=659352 RepID=UPI0032119875
MSLVVPLLVLAWAYVATLRSVRLLVLLTLFVFGLPEVGLVHSLLWTAGTAMSLYWAVSFYEAIRSGDRAVPAGQIEVGRALGLTYTQIQRLIALPLEFRSAVQPLAPLLIATTLNSSLAATVGATQEPTGRTQFLDLQYAQPLTTFGAAAVCYVALTLGIRQTAAALDCSNGGRAGPATAFGTADPPQSGHTGKGYDSSHLDAGSAAARGFAHDDAVGFPGPPTGTRPPCAVCSASSPPPAHP